MDMMKKQFHVVVEQGEDGYLISEVIGLPGCRSQARTHEELMLRTKEAIELYLSVKEDSGTKFLSLDSSRSMYDPIARTSLPRIN